MAGHGSRETCPPYSTAITTLNQPDDRATDMLQKCYSRSMTTVPSRELRNDTAGVLRRVQSGEEVTITVNGRAVAMITALKPRRRRSVSKTELIKRLQTSQADPGLRDDLAELAGETTDELDEM